MVWIASCQCSCTPGARCWKTQLENRPHHYIQCATEADWNSTELAVDGDLPRSCIYNWIGALVGTALLAAFAKWPRYQVFTFLGCLGFNFFVFICVNSVPNLIEGKAGPDEARKLVHPRLCAFSGVV